MAFVSAMVGPIVESFMGPVKRHLGYLFSSTDNLKTMETRMNELDRTRDEIMKQKERNDRNTLEEPAGVPSWLEEVEKIKKEAQSISSNSNGSCFNLKARYQVGRKSWKKVLEIERLNTEGGTFHWSDARKPLARVNTNRASTSAPSRGDDFKSRYTIFKNALMFLQDDKTQVIALCGMGGVGKTTMMEQLKKVAKDKKMFDWIVKVVLGKQPKTFSIQQVVAETLSHSLTESEEETRAERLREVIEKILEKDKKGILVILDDVWRKFELKDVGLSPLPNGVKLLLTSRYEDLCRSFAVQAGHLDLKVLKVDVLEKTEAQKFFCQITGVSEEHDPELYQIGGKIVKKCSYLPLAIKLIASTLKSESKSGIWRDRLRCLQKNGPDQDVHEIINMSYNYLKEEEDKEIFLLCGLFPEDSNIRIEDLTRYAWGLQLLDGVSTLEDARDRTEACVSHLKNAHLLIDGDDPRYVKLHDLVLDFVVATVSKGDRASLIKHGDVSTWSPVEMSDSYRRISLSCKGLPEFPKGFKSPNLSLLKLMNGDDLYRFPEDFYGDTEKLEVMAYEKFRYPWLSRLLQCSTNLRTLCLHQCSLMFDCSFIGNLVNLEVLSFSDSFLRELPSSVGNLKKLKLLDLTGCFGVKINDGVLENLVKLEEIYMRDIVFTERNSNELAGHSRNLLALEIRCFENKGQLKNMSYENLKRFKIYMGDFYNGWEDELKLFGNKLYLVTNKVELLEFGMNGLLEKTEELCLEVDGMTNLEDIEVKSLHSPQHSSFCNLRSLMVSKCAELRFIFTVGVATALSKLEHLDISSCKSMQELIHIESSEPKRIEFPMLKFLRLHKLPKLLSLCKPINVIALPQLIDLRLDGLPNFTSIYPKKKLATSSMAINDSAWRSFLNEEVVVPKLEKLRIQNMENLKDIWACQYSSSKEGDVCILREIDVTGCDGLVNLFPSNSMTLMQHVEDLKVENCGSIEALFNIDLGCVGEIEKVSCRLRSIEVTGLRKLREVWRIKGENNSGILIHGFQAVESLTIKSCKRFRNVFTPTTTNFDMRALKRLYISYCGEREGNNELVKSNQQQEIDVISNEEISEVGDMISSVVFPSYLIHTFHHDQTLGIYSCKGAKTVFEIDSPSSRELETNQATQQLPLLPYLEDIYLEGMDCMSHVWKCNWNEFLIIQKQQPKCSFHNLTTIWMEDCKSIKFLFSPLMAELLCNLKEIYIVNCIVIEEVVSNKDDEVEERTTNTSTNLFPRLDILDLRYLPNLKHIGGGGTIHDQFQFSQEDITSWSLCQYSREIYLSMCHALSSAIPFNAGGQMQKLENLTIWSCNSLVEVFETQGTNNSGCRSTNIDEGSDTTLAISRPKNINVPQLSNLRELDINGCDLLQHVFTFATLESLRQLHELTIQSCKAMKVIVKEESHEEQTTPPSQVVIFRRLKSIALVNLPTLTGFFLGMNDFQWPFLDKVKIDACPQMTVFTRGCSEAPKVNNIYTKLGKHSLESLNFPQLPQEVITSWSLCKYSKQIHLDKCDALSIAIPFNAVVCMQRLERLTIYDCDSLVEVFETQRNFDEGSDTTWSTMAIPRPKNINVPQLSNLKELEIFGCNLLQHVFTFATLESLQQLHELNIEGCEAMKVIVKEESREEQTATPKVVVFPRLKSIALVNLPTLTGFFLGMNDFQWPLLDELMIDACPQMTVFTRGCSEAPKLNNIYTNLGKHSLECGPNFPQNPCSSLDGTGGSYPTTSEGIRWSFNNLIEIDVEHNHDVEQIIPSNELLQVQKLERIHVKYCYRVEEVFEALEDSGLSELPFVVKIPKLREVELNHLIPLKYIWKSNSWMVLEFPNLTKVSIHRCESLEHVFSSSMVGSLLQLQELHLWGCTSMEVIVEEANVVIEEEEEECDTKIILPRLKSLQLSDLPRLKGFYLGKEAFSWPSLDTLKIMECPAITGFTKAHSETPKLKVIDTNFGRCVVEEDLNSFIKNRQEKGLFGFP